MYTQFPLDFKQKKYLFSWFDKHMRQHTYYYPLVSGGADSMFMMHCLFDYFFTKGRDVSTITPLHINHKQRASSEKEEDFLRDYFRKFNINILHINNSTLEGKTENHLRKERRKLIEKYISSTKEGVIITGHNLSDRVETTFLHMIRGCKLPGVVNMLAVESKGSKKMSFPIFRPLLHLSKETITSLCQQLNIPFFDDLTNSDPLISQRNNIRIKVNSFLMKYTEDEKNIREEFWKQITTLYNYIVKSYQIQHQLLCVLKPSVYREATSYYVTQLPIHSTDTYSLFTALGILSGISSATLTEYTDFFVHASSGWKWCKGRYFIISHGKAYCIKKSFCGPFWEKNNTGECLAIESLGVYTIGDFSWNILKKERIGGTVRHAKSSDRRRGKKLGKFFINKKIPLFWRNYYPVIEKNGEIITILDTSYLIGHI